MSEAGTGAGVENGEPKLRIDEFCFVRNNSKRSGLEHGTEEERFLHPAYWIGRVVECQDGEPVKISWFAKNPFIKQIGIFSDTGVAFVEAAASVQQLHSNFVWNETLQGYTLLKDIDASVQKNTTTGGSGPDRSAAARIFAGFQAGASKSRTPSPTSSKPAGSDVRRPGSESGTSSPSPKSSGKKTESDSPLSDNVSETPARIGSAYQVCLTSRRIVIVYVTFIARRRYQKYAHLVANRKKRSKDTSSFPFQMIPSR